jgi:hypothetical protein
VWKVELIPQIDFQVAGSLPSDLLPFDQTSLGGGFAGSSGSTRGGRSFRGGRRRLWFGRCRTRSRALAVGMRCVR